MLRKGVPYTLLAILLFPVTVTSAFNLSAPEMIPVSGFIAALYRIFIEVQPTIN